MHRAMHDMNAKELLSRADEVMMGPLAWFANHPVTDAAELIGLLAGYLRAYMQAKDDLEEIALTIANPGYGR